MTVKSGVPSTITSPVYKISTGLIGKIKIGTTANTLLSNIIEKAYCEVVDTSNKTVAGDKVIGTGMMVKLKDGNTVKGAWTAIVTGDVNGDGAVSITDLLAVKSHLLKKTTLSGPFATAADTNGDGTISITDFIQIKAYILKKGTIEAR